MVRERRTPKAMVKGICMLCYWCNIEAQTGRKETA